jgi:S-adenosylmethionine:tRNA ribosyltransferase-isomerase
VIALGKLSEPRLLQATPVDKLDVRLVTIEGSDISIAPFASIAERLRAGDLVVVNDAATLPGSLFGTLRGETVELRVTGPIERTLHGVLLGAGDWRMRTEDRAAPPHVNEGDVIRFGDIAATVVAARGKLVELAVADPLGLVYARGVPIQYAYRTAQLPLWDVQTSYAARPWAAEMPSAGRPLAWETILALKKRGVAIATLTHAAGLSSTGDAELDRALPWPERFEIPDRTRAAIAAADRVIAIGTTVVRALEADALGQRGVATLRIDVRHQLRVVDGLVSGLHVPGESHFDLLQAFAPRRVLARAIDAAVAAGLSSHELGDACLIL